MGKAGSDMLNGGDDNDQLSGDLGTDSLKGENDNDLLISGP
jgi:Ca2+-binding RTX toxin-like protein